MKTYWGILDPQGECIQDILSAAGEGGAWISLWNKRYPDSRHYSIKELAEKYMSEGFKPVILEAINGEMAGRANSKRSSKKATSRRSPMARR